MRYLNSYKVFENVNEIINNLNDILLELNDEGFNCKAHLVNDGDVYSKIPIGYKLIKTHDVIHISIARETGYDIYDVLDVFYRIKSYLTSNGYQEYGDYENSEALGLKKNIKGAGKTMYSYIKFIKEI